MESEWKQVSSGLQDSPHYSSRSQPCCGLYGLDFYFDFQIL